MDDPHAPWMESAGKVPYTAVVILLVYTVTVGALLDTFFFDNPMQTLIFTLVIVLLTASIYRTWRGDPVATEYSR